MITRKRMLYPVSLRGAFDPCQLAGGTMMRDSFARLEERNCEHLVNTFGLAGWEFLKRSLGLPPPSDLLMKSVCSAQQGIVTRRWAFFIGDQLAVAGVALQEGSGTTRARLIETEQHADTTPFPERLRLEGLIRRQVQRDARQASDTVLPLPIQFEPRKWDALALASAFSRPTDFGAFSSQDQATAG